MRWDIVALFGGMLLMAVYIGVDCTSKGGWFPRFAQIVLTLVVLLFAVAAFMPLFDTYVMPGCCLR